MQLVSPGGSLLAPSVCFICEQRPGALVVDTLRVFEPNGPTSLTGRKYVCEGCIQAMGQLVGLTSDEALERLQSENSVLRQKIKEVKQKLAFIQEVTV